MFCDFFVVLILDNRTQVILQFLRLISFQEINYLYSTRTETSTDGWQYL